MTPQNNVCHTIVMGKILAMELFLTLTKKNGGLNGSETITYCNTEDYSNMVFVDDLSVEGSSLLSSRARLIITGSNRVEEIQLNTDETIDAENKR